MDFGLSTRQVDSALVVDLSGRLTAGEPVQLFKETLRNHYDQGQRHFVINLANASHVDSSGIGALIGVWTTLRKLREKSGDGGLVLLNLSPAIRDLMIITRLSTVFLSFDNEPAAVAAALA
jgi:anti-sigma B factor antagonist